MTRKAGPALAGHVALLRGVNVGGKHSVPMAALREVAAALGWTDLRTHLQSGNLVFAARGSPAACERALEHALQQRFGFPVPVIVRTGAQWRTLAAGSPFPDAEGERPQLLHLCLAKGPLPAAAGPALQQQAGAGERVAVRGGALWIDYAGGVARSKLGPALLDRTVGSVVTARNWRTVAALAAMVGP